MLCEERESFLADLLIGCQDAWEASNELGAVGATSSTVELLGADVDGCVCEGKVVDPCS